MDDVLHVAMARAQVLAVGVTRVVRSNAAIALVVNLVAKVAGSNVPIADKVPDAVRAGISEAMIAVTARVATNAPSHSSRFPKSTSL